MYRWSPLILISFLLLLSVVLYSRKVNVDVDILSNKHLKAPQPRAQGPLAKGDSKVTTKAKQ